MTRGGDDFLAALRDPASPQAQHLAHTDLLMLQAGVDQFVDNSATDDLWAALVTLASTPAQAETQAQRQTETETQVRRHAYSESYHEVLFEAAHIRESALATARAFLRDPACPRCTSTDLARGGLTVQTHTSAAAAATAAATTAAGLRGFSIGSWRDTLLAVRLLFLLVLVTYAASFAAAGGASGANAMGKGKGKGKRKGKGLGTVTDKGARVVSSLSDILMAALPFLGGSGSGSGIGGGSGSSSGGAQNAQSSGSNDCGASTGCYAAVPATPPRRTTASISAGGPVGYVSPSEAPLGPLHLRIRADAPVGAGGGAPSPRRSPRLRR
jgi:hypothetical protein